LSVSLDCCKKVQRHIKWSVVCSSFPQGHVELSISVWMYFMCRLLRNFIIKMYHMLELIHYNICSLRYSLRDADQWHPYANPSMSSTWNTFSFTLYNEEIHIYNSQKYPNFCMKCNNWYV
jgi:hypothetical protein